MTKAQVRLLAALTVWPFAVPLIGLSMEVTGLIPIAATQPPPAFVFVLVILFLTPIQVLALLVFYLGYLFTKSQLSTDWKLVWAAALVIGHVFAMPVFWYLHIWKPTSPNPISPSSRFSLLVFAPLLAGLVLPLAYLVPMTLMTSVLSFSSHNAAAAAAYWAWVVGPVAAAGIIFLLGKSCYPWFITTTLTRARWGLLWSFFSVMSFGVVLYATIVLRGLVPSDAPPNTLSNLARVALVLTLVLQPGVPLWLFVVNRRILT